MTLVGTYVGLSRWLVTAFPVFVLAGLRFAIAALCMLPWLKRQPGESRLQPGDHRRLFITGLFGNVLFTLCILQGVAWSSAMAAGVVMATLPGVVALLARVWLKEPVPRTTWLGVACAVAGVAMVALQGPLTPHLTAKHSLAGHALLLCAVLCEATNLVLARRLAQTVSPQRITAWVNLWSLLLMAPLALWQGWPLSMAHIPLLHWAALAFYAIASSVIAVWLWMRGALHVPAARAGLFTVCLPIAATAVGVLWLGETLTMMKATAVLLALVGIVLATAQQH